MRSDENMLIVWLHVVYHINHIHVYSLMFRVPGRLMKQIWRQPAVGGCNQHISSTASRVALTVVHPAVQLLAVHATVSK